MLNSLKSYISDDEFRVNIFRNKINITNYIEIITLEDNRVSIKYDKGKIIIKGNNLSLNKLLDNEILITGELNIIELE